MRLKFVSLNVWNGGTLWEPMVEFLKKENPDILALQETQSTHDPFTTEPRLKTLDFLSPKLSLPYRMSAPMFNWFGKDDTVATDIGNAVLSRSTIIQADHWFFTEPKYGHIGREGTGDVSKRPRNLQHVLLQINAKQLHVFNIQGIWGADGNDTPERLAMSHFILEKIGDKKPAILCGDFNTDATSQSIKNVAAKLHDVFGADKRVTSFNMKQKPVGSGYATAVVDFIFTTPDIKIISHETPNVDVSDHMPLVMEFEI